MAKQLFRSIGFIIDITSHKQVDLLDNLLTSTQVKIIGEGVQL